jgi:membrane-associated protease RseP (regulator of RpoE activity)
MDTRIGLGAICLSFLLSGSAAAAHHEEPVQNVVVTTTVGTQGWLGVSIQDMSKDLAKKKKVKAEEGALVTDVRKKSPAESAGIKEDDIIVEFNGKPISDVEDLQKAVRKAEPGKEATVAIVRQDQRKVLKVTIGKPPKGELSTGYAIAAPPMRHFTSFFSSSEMYGLTLSELNQQLGEYFGAPNGRGVLVTEVEKESEGEKAGFRAGDVIIHIGRETVEDIRDISEGLEDFKEGEKATVEVLRRGEKKSLTLTVEESESFGWNSGSTFVAPRIPRVPDIRISIPRIEYEMQDLEGLRHIREGESKQMEALQEELRHIQEGKSRQREALREELRHMRTGKMRDLETLQEELYERAKGMQEEAKALQGKLRRDVGSVRT